MLCLNLILNFPHGPLKLSLVYHVCPYTCLVFWTLQVETIGDAYMAVGGIHRTDKEHARNTVSMGIEMVEKASEVYTPSNESIQASIIPFCC